MMWAGATGLEPAASGVTGRRSNQLNYAPAWDTRGETSGKREFTKCSASFQPNAAFSQRLPFRARITYASRNLLGVSAGFDLET